MEPDRKQRQMRKGHVRGIEHYSMARHWRRTALLVKEYALASLCDATFRRERFEAGCQELGI